MGISKFTQIVGTGHIHEQLIYTRYTLIIYSNLAGLSNPVFLEQLKLTLEKIRKCGLALTRLVSTILYILVIFRIINGISVHPQAVSIRQLFPPSHNQPGPRLIKSPAGIVL